MDQAGVNYPEGHEFTLEDFINDSKLREFLEENGEDDVEYWVPRFAKMALKHFEITNYIECVGTQPKPKKYDGERCPGWLPGASKCSSGDSGKRESLQFTEIA